MAEDRTERDGKTPSATPPQEQSVKQSNKSEPAKKRGPVRGTADGHTVADQPLDDSELVTEASEESFPASDPPAYTGITGSGGPKR